MRARGDASAYQPPRLPRSAAGLDGGLDGELNGELDEWAVYADHLISLGDPRGDAIALDLALPAACTRAEVEMFHAAATPVCRQGGATAIGWTLGHARTLRVAGIGGVGGVGGVGGPVRRGPEAGTLGRARDFITRPVGRLLEELWIEYAPGEHAAHWRRLLRALPASCTRVVIGVPTPRVTAAQLDDLVAMLPDHVRELALARRLEGELTTHVVSDRFARVDLSRAHLEPAQLAQLRDRLGATRAVEVRLANLGAEILRAPRCTLGGPGDAAVVTVAARQACALPRWTLLALQNRHGLVPVRAQWAGSCGEGHALMRTALGFYAVEGKLLMRHGPRWTLSGYYDHVRLGGVEVGQEQIAEVPDGAWISVREIETLLFTTDADAQARARVGQRTL